MTTEVSKEEILSHLNSWGGFEKEITEEGEAFTVKLSNGNKSVLITTPYEVGEFFLDFLIHDKPYYSDWYEIMDDSLDEFMSYTEQVAKNFLFNEVRVKQRGWWVFKVHDLQYLKKGIWVNVFSPET